MMIILSSGKETTKKTVLFFFPILQLLGVAILGVSILVYVDSQNYVAFEETSELYMTPFLLLIALGALMTLVGFVGCCGAIREAPCFLVTVSYFLFYFIYSHSFSLSHPL